jgi:hypothetical protein
VQALFYCPWGTDVARRLGIDSGVEIMIMILVISPDQWQA